MGDMPTRNYRTTPLPFKVALGNLERQMAEHLQRQGQRLKQARKSLKLSQEDAAHLIGVSAKTYGAWERGTSEPRDSNWRRIENELKIRAEEIRGEPPESQLDRIEAKLDQILELVLPATQPAVDVDDLAPPESVAPPTRATGRAAKKRSATRAKRSA